MTIRIRDDAKPWNSFLVRQKKKALYDVDGDVLCSFEPESDLEFC
jgi:hypothetical protein